VPLGTPGSLVPELPEHPRHGLLAFGHFGSNKYLEPVLEAAVSLSRRRDDVRLQVGGTSSRHNPGYLAALSGRSGASGCVTFLGYVEEAAVAALFSRAAVSILPYATVTGMSSVALQSAMYGTSIVASDIPGFRALADEGLAMHFFTWPDPKSLEGVLERVLDMPADARRREAQMNLEYCRRQRLELVVDQYVDILEALTTKTRGIPEPA
jgi:glycosyltransferase involved in cell wall biosynthesis